MEVSVKQMKIPLSVWMPAKGWCGKKKITCDILEENKKPEN